MRSEKLTPRRWKKKWWLVAVAAVGLVAAGCIPSGSYDVASSGFGKVSPGLYRTAGTDPNSLAVGGCFWRRKDASGAFLGQGPFTTPEPFAGLNATETGPQYVEILPTDAGFESTACQLWWKVPWAKSSVTPGAPFSVGDYLVGSEVAPGTYTAPNFGFGCWWYRVRDFQGTQSSIIQQGGGNQSTVTVTIDAADYGFESAGACGNWVKVN
jgi:hypothetical protein